MDHRGIIIEELPEETKEERGKQGKYSGEALLIIRLTSEWRVRWDLFVMLLATWNCFAIPLEIGIDPDTSRGILWVLFNYLIDFIFVFDIILAFRTSYLYKGEEITSVKKITIHYLTGRFMIDVLSILPFDLTDIPAF